MASNAPKTTGFSRTITSIADIVALEQAPYDELVPARNLYQLFEANFGLLNASANGGGTAFFAHVGGFVFGALVAWLLTQAGRIAPQDVAMPATTWRGL